MLIMTMRERLNEKNNNARDEYFLQLPSGHRFVPTDEELIVHYLRKKELGQELPRNRIHQASVYQLRPDQLAEAYPLVRETAWYFFTSRQRKYANGSRPSRSVEGGGFWKPTGIPRPILAGCDQTCIGFRRALDFYADRKDPTCSKTEWKMLEYILPPPPTLTPTTGHPSSISRPAPPLPQEMRLEGWALCKIYRAAERNKKRKYENEEEEDVDATTNHEDETDEKKDVDPSDSGVMAISYHHHEEDDSLYQLVAHVLDDGPNSDRLDVRY